MYTKALIPAVFYIILFIVLPSANNSLDAYGYASDIAKGENLLLPHHLLYNLSGFCLTNFFEIEAANTMQILVLMNSIMAGACLFFVYLILHLVIKPIQQLTDKKDALHPMPMVFLLGATFGFMRFATENETYIAPLLFSLAGTWQIFEYKLSQKRRQIWIGILLLAIGVLFHQIHIFWYLSFAVHLLFFENRKNAMAVFTSAIMIALVYFVSAHLSNENLFYFIIHDARTSTVSFLPILEIVKFTFINLLRTLWQLHGNILIFIKGTLGIWPAMIATIAGIFFLIAFFRVSNISKRKEQNRFISHAIGFTMIFQFVFAAFSSGNAEFMVMLPFLAIIFLTNMWTFDTRPFWLGATCLLVWNIGYALIPAAKYDLNGFEKTYSNLKHRGEMVLVARNAIHFGNYLEYKQKDLKRLTILKSPADSDDSALLFKQIDSAIKHNILVLTDCIDYPEFGSRKSLLSGNANDILKTRYSALSNDSIEVYFGQIKLKQITFSK